MTLEAPLPRRILMTADPLGGVWSYGLTLAREFRETEILLYVMGGALSTDQRRKAAALPNVKVVETGFSLEWMDDPWADVDAAGAELLKCEADFSPDIVHLNGYVHAALPWKTPVLIVAHSCVVSWWKAVKGTEPPGRYESYREQVSAGLRCAQSVVAPTRAMLVTLKENYGFGGPGCVIPNGCGSTELFPEIKEAVVITSGRLWDEAKNYAALDAAAAELPWPVLVAGNEEHPSGGRCGFPNLRSLGALGFGEMARHFRTASIFAHPALYEPFGLSALEAALCGCALVLGDIPSLREVWENAALYVDPRDANALRRALASLIASPDQLRALGLRARQRALRYSATAMACGYRKLYAETAAQQGKAE